MEVRPDPSEVPANLLKHMRKSKNWKWLQEQWNAKYPNNQVEVIEDADD